MERLGFVGRLLQVGWLNGTVAVEVKWAVAVNDIATVNGRCREKGRLYEAEARDQPAALATRRLGH